MLFTAVQTILAVLMVPCLFAGDLPETRTFFWYQGESETGPAPNDYHLSLIFDRNREAYAILHLSQAYFPPPSEFSSFSYGNLHMGDVIPMSGKLFRISRLDTTGDRMMRLEAVDPEKLPSRVRVNPNNLAIPSNSAVVVRRTQFDVQALRIIVVDITDEESNERGVTARILIRSYGLNYLEPVDYPQVRAGDVLKVSGAGLIVRKIVPPIPKHGIVGWVEFDPTPVKLDEIQDETVEPQEPNDQPQRRRIRNPRRLFRRIRPSS